MAGRAASRGMLVGIARAVAACAACRGMSALQREAGAGMIGRPGLPRTCLVAGRAVRAPAAAVRLVLRLAGDACRATAFPAVPGMAPHEVGNDAWRARVCQSA